MYTRPHKIKGKWHGHTYEVKRELGRGANGIVYLVLCKNREYALKVGEDSFSISSEVNVLQHFVKVQGTVLGPSVYDVDDWQNGNEIRPFYVMNVIKGEPLTTFISRKGKEWIPVLFKQLLGFLSELHQQKWVFGDLKPDHLLVVHHPPQIAWFDAGGVTKMGRGIKEYTEVYDRGYWMFGDRKAEPAYDLFSATMIFLQLHKGEPLRPTQNPKQQLYNVIYEDDSLFPYQDVLWAALTGHYQTAAEMRLELVEAWRTKNKKKKVRVKQPKKRKADKKKRSVALTFGKVISFLFISSFFIFLFTLYLFSQSLS